VSIHARLGLYSRGQLTAAALGPRVVSRQRAVADLPHTSATLMLANGEHPKIVQERLGHSTISMTLDRYSHVTESMQREAAQRLEGLVSAAAEQTADAHQHAGDK
jgi:integrase